MITVTSDTKLVSITFSDNQVVESEISLPDLQEGAMIQYTLAENSTDALKITVRPAGGPEDMSTQARKKTRSKRHRQENNTGKTTPPA
ncbi:hypothetical protein LMZ02_04185 [Paenibacillus macerans]|uniref:hypothetical protein n=1 Tax=Paenibacillus macerans TaxID=44252 RepID=UPI001F0E9D1F|nr:hypothetical protein [Paenibacillus macerans]UMV48602.1 hypothetical protein LMZ02_04185 [Paenibacillus macerans]